MAISTVSQKGLDSPLTLTSPVLNSPVISGTPTGTLVSANMPTGSVLQVVQANYNTFTSTTSTTLVATGMSATITPKFSTSKILVMINANGVGASVVNNAIQFYLFKNSSGLASIDGIISYGGTTNYSGAYQYLDSPATTSATTYQLYWRTINTNIAYLNNYGGSPDTTRSTITLMEIAG